MTPKTLVYDNKAARILQLQALVKECATCTTIFGYQPFPPGAMPPHLMTNKAYAFVCDAPPPLLKVLNGATNVFSGFMVEYDQAKKRINPAGFAMANGKQFVLQAGERKILT